MWVFFAVFLGLLMLPGIAAAKGELSIIEPLDGQNIAPGQVLRVKFKSTVGNVVDLVEVLGIGTQLSIGEENIVGIDPFVIEAPVSSSTRPGVYVVQPFLFLKDGRFLTSNPIYITVPPLSKKVVFTNDGFMLYFPGESRYVDVGFVDETGRSIAVFERDERSVVFRSLDPAIATVDKDGIVTGIAPGETKIEASFGQSSATFTVLVNRVSKRGDFNGDGLVNSQDITALKDRISLPKVGPLDARDLNGDGKIDALDLRVLTTLCTRPRCAVQ